MFDNQINRFGSITKDNLQHKVDFCIVNCAGRSTVEWSNLSEGQHPHGRQSHTFNLSLNPNSYPDGKARDIDVLKVDVAKVNLACASILVVSLTKT